MMKRLIFLAVMAGLAAPSPAKAWDEAPGARFELPAMAAADFDAADQAAAPEPVPARDVDWAKAQDGQGKIKLGPISKAERKGYIARAELWRPEGSFNTAAMDFKAGPFEKMKYAPEELVTCSYVPMKEAYDEGRPNGTTRKFKCADKKGKRFKVKYGPDNRELMTEVASSWILTAIGAYADRMYPVRLNCPDCPSDPFKSEADRGAWQQGQMVVIEEKIGERMEYKPNSGIGFDEFYRINDRVGAEALSGLAHFLGNSDNKAPNQAIACQKNDVAADASGKAVCLKPIAYMQDLGISFGGHKFYHNSRMDFDRWAKEKLWDDPSACVMNLKATHTSSISGTDHSGRDLHQIGEQARQLLARRLSLLSRQQLMDIFTASRAPLHAPRHSAEEWADLFLGKVERLRNPMGARTKPGFACPYPVVPPNSTPSAFSVVY